MRTERGRGGSVSVGFLPLLALLFIGLKLGGVIDWSWWWVLVPLWGPLALFLAFLAVVALIVVIGSAIGEK